MGCKKGLGHFSVIQKEKRQHSLFSFSPYRPQLTLQGKLRYNSDTPLRIVLVFLKQTLGLFFNPSEIEK